jgi:hypothetical protein
MRMAEILRDGNLQESSHPLTMGVRGVVIRVAWCAAVAEHNGVFESDGSLVVHDPNRGRHLP